MEETAAETAPVQKPRRRVSTGQIVGFLIGLAIVIAIFAFAVPKFADYGEVFAAMRTLTPLEFWSLFAAMVFNLYTYWLANQAGLIGMTIWQSAVETQTSTTIANILPAGGALAIAMTAAILSSWGFTAGEITLFVGVTGIWNIFAKLGLPVVALALLVLTGHSYPALVAAAAVGCGRVGRGDRSPRRSSSRARTWRGRSDTPSVRSSGASAGSSARAPRTTSATRP